MRNFRWETVDGRKIRIRDLEQSHLENILVHLDTKLAKLPKNRRGNMFQWIYDRRKKHLETWVRRINKELARRSNPDANQP